MGGGGTAVHSYRPRYFLYWVSTTPVFRASESLAWFSWNSVAISRLWAPASVACACTTGRLSSTPAAKRSRVSDNACVARPTLLRATFTNSADDSLPSLVVNGMSLNEESNRSPLDRDKELMPGLIAWNMKSTRSPSPVAPGMSPTRVSALLMASPPMLSMSPGMKNVLPAEGKKLPSEMLKSCRMVGSKARSNWKAYRSETSAMLTGTVKIWSTETSVEPAVITAWAVSNGTNNSAAARTMTTETID